MEENKKDILKKGLLKTDTDFTANLINKINADEAALSKVLTKHGTVSTSVDFTAQLMSQLEEKTPAIPYKPVISRPAWIAIAAIFIGFIGLTLFSGTENSHQLGIEGGLQNLKNGVDAIFSGDSTFQYFMLGALLLSLGLVVEQKISERV